MQEVKTLTWVIQPGRDIIKPVSDATSEGKSEGETQSWFKLGSQACLLPVPRVFERIPETLWTEQSSVECSRITRLKDIDRTAGGGLRSDWQ